jgi:hypothetical protein
MRRFQILTLYLLLGTAATGAQWNENGRPVPDTASAKSKEGFGAMLLLTDEPQKFIAEWQSSPPEHQPSLSTVDEAPRNKQVVAFVFFSGCRTASGTCDCTVDFTVLRPDGSVYGEQKDAELWRGKPPMPGNNLQLSAANLAITIESKDPLGTYTIKAKVKDNVTGTAIDLATPLKAVDKRP